MALAVSAALLASSGAATHALAQSLVWDASGNAGTTGLPTDGSGTWSTSNANWYAGSVGTPDTGWNNSGSNIAVFGNGGPAGNVTVSTPITFAGMTFNSTTGTYNISGGSALTIAGPGPALFTMNNSAIVQPLINGTTGITVSGTGTLIFTSAENYSGTTTINSGSTLQLGNGSGSAGSISNSPVSNNGTIQYDRATTISNLISGTGNLVSLGTVANGTGTYTATINNVMTYTGTTSVLGGTLAVNPTANFNTSSSISLGGGPAGLDTFTLSANRSSSVVVAGTTINPGMNLLNIGGMNSSSNTFNLGTLTHNAGGILNFQTLPSVGTISTTSSNLNLPGGAPTILGGYAFIPVAGQNDLNFATINSSNGAISAFTGYTTVTGASAALPSGLDLNISNNGTAATVSGAQTVNSLKFSAGQNTINVNAPLTIATGGVLVGNVGGNYQTFSGSGSLTSGTNDLDFILNSNAVSSINVGVPITDNSNGPVGLSTGVVNGKLNLYLYASNTYTGDTNINSISVQGNDTTIIVGNPLALQNSTVNLNNTINFNSSTAVGTSNLFFGSSGTGLGITAATLGGLKGTTNLTAQQLISGNTTGQNVAINLSIGNNNQSTTYAGVLTDAGSVSKIGTGVWTLTNTNAITGNTNINSGTIKLTGSASLGNTPVISVASGATFDVSGLTSPLALTGSQTIAGTGTVVGPMSLASGAQISPGVNATTNVGVLTTGSLNLSSGSILNEYFGTPGTTGSPGISGLVSVTGNVILPASGLKLNLYDNANNNGQGSIEAGVYDILNYTGTLSGFNSSTFTVLNTPLVGRTYTFTNTGSQIDLTIGAAALALTWTGANSSSWDTTTSSVNWANGTSPTYYANPNAVTFGDTSAVTGNQITNSNIVVQTGGVTPSTVTVSSNNVNYNVSNAGGDLVGINGSTGISKTGTSTLTLNGPNSFTGPVSIAAGVVTIANGNALGNIGALSGANVSSGAALQLTNNITTNAQPLAINGSYSSSVGALNNLSGSNTYAGQIKLAGPASVTTSAGTLALTGGVNTNGNPLSVTGNVNINTGAISGSGSLTYNGGGTLTLGTGHTFTGGTTIAAGTVNIAGDTSLGAIPTSASTNLTFSGNATLQAGASNVNLSANRSISIGGGATATFDTNGNSMGVNGAITGSSANGIVKVGSGTLTIGAGSSYSGTTTISGGTLALNAGVATAPVPGAIVQIDASKLSSASAPIANLGSGGGSFSVVGAAPTLSTSSANQIYGHQALVFNGGGGLSSSNAYSNTGTMMTVFMVEQANNTGGAYSGDLSFASPGTTDWNVAGNMAVEDDADGAHIRPIVENNQNAAELVRPTTPMVWDSTVSVQANSATSGTVSARLTTNSNGAAATNTASGTVTGGTPYNLSLIGISGRFNAGTLTGGYFNGAIGEVLVYNTALTPAQTQAVESYLDGKWLNIGGGSLPSTTTLAIAGGSTFDLNGNNQQVASLVNSGATGGIVTNSNSALSSVLSLSSSGTFGGVIQNGNSPVGLSITGGTQVLTGANTYTGPTTITNGKLLVGSGGTLGATAVTVNNNGIFAPNPGTGSISIASLNLVNGGTVDMTDGAAGTLNLTGPGIALDIGSGLTSVTTLNFDLGTTGADKIADAGSALVQGTSTINITTLGSSLTTGTFPLISATSGLTGSFQFSNGLTTESVTVGSTLYNLTLANSSTAENLVVFVPGTSSVWTGADSASPTKWQDAGNWSGGIPGSTTGINSVDSVTFNSGAPAPVVDAGRNVQNITFDTGGVGQLNLGGSTLTLTGNGTVQSTSSVSSDETISAPLVLEGNYSFLSNSGNNNALILNGNISGGTAAGAMIITLGGSSTGGNVVAGKISTGAASSVALVKSGSGNWSLTQANNFTGGTSINSGVLTIADGALGSGSVTFNGGTLQYAAGAVTTDISGQITGSTAAITIDTNGDSVTFANALNSTNTSGLTKLNNGTLTLSGSNSYGGATNIAGGALNIAGNSALPSTTSVTVANGAALQISGGTTVSTTPVSIVGTGPSSAGALESVTGSNTYAGPITLSSDATIGADAGTLNLPGTISAGTANLTLNSNGTINVTGNITGTTGNVTLAGTGNGNISGNLVNGTGTLTQNSPGTWALSGNNTYTGGTTLNAGVTQINSVNSLGAASGPVTINSATVEVTSTFPTFRSYSVGSSSSTIQVDSGQTFTVASPISGGGALNKTGTGTLALTAANSYSGGTVISAGTVSASNPGALGSSTVTLAGTSPTLQIVAPPAGVSGFGGASNTGWTLNRYGNADPGNPPSVSASNVLTLTDTNNTEARSAFYNTPLPYNLFTASFVYQESAVNGGADGIAFVLQNSAAGASAVENEGGNLGYTGGATVMGNSVALGWELYGSAGVKTGVNGTFGNYTPTQPAGLLGSGDPIAVTISGSANSNVLNLSLTDQTTNVTYSNSYSLSNTLSNILGGTTAYVGFTGSTGGVNAVQTISNFSYPAAPVTGAFNLGNNLNVTANGTFDVGYTNGVNMGQLTINSGNTLTLTNSQSSGTALVTFNGMNSVGTLDITRDAVDIQNSSVGTISSQIASGYHGGAWNGNSPSGAIVSSSAALDSTHLTAVGVATNLSTFEGQSINTSDVLIKLTYYGDANLDGQVNSADYTMIDAGFLSNGSLTGWQNGDFNYDSVINGSDYTLIDNAFNMQGAQIASQIASPTAQVAGGASAVPEPTSLGLLCLGTMGLLSRRRRRLL